jgi:hypothetical protein
LHRILFQLNDGKPEFGSTLVNFFIGIIKPFKLKLFWLPSGSLTDQLIFLLMAAHSLAFLLMA